MATKLDFTRQSTLVPKEVAGFVTAVIGAGAIGSHVAETLAKTGIGTLHLWDADTVEPHNLPNQGFYWGDLGKKKVLALQQRLEEGTGVQVIPHDAFFDETSDFGDAKLVVSALDSMAARKVVFMKFLSTPTAQVFIDGRMGSRFGKVFLVDKSDKDSVTNYLASLHSDSEAAEEPCTARATIFCAYGLAGLMCATLVSWLVGEQTPYYVSADFRNFRVLPQARLATPQ